MTTSTPIEHLFAAGTGLAYLVCAAPDWIHFHPTDLPAPIADWIARHAPETPILRIEILSFGIIESLDSDQAHDECLAALEISPLFQLGFTPEQAAAFQSAWNKPDGSPSDDPEFYFFEVVPSTADSDIRRARGWTWW